MQEDLRNRYFQQNQQSPYPSQGPPPPYNPVLQQYEPTTPRSSGAALAFWLFVLFALMACAAYFGYFAPLISRLRAKIKELTPVPDTDSMPTRPAPLWFQVIKDDDEEGNWEEGEVIEEEEEVDTETTMMAQPDINDRFAKLMGGYGLLDKSQMNGKNVSEHFLSSNPEDEVK